MSNQDINSAWAAVTPILGKFDFYDIKNIVGLTGFDIETLNALGIDYNKEKNKPEMQLISEIGGYFFNFPDEKKKQFLNIIIEEILSGRFKLHSSYLNEEDDIEERLHYYLNRLGWQLIDNKVLSKEILDSSDLEELDTSAREDLIKAATRFRDGDLSGAITAACAAVDSVTTRIYQDNALGDAKDARSFQEKCSKSFTAIGIFDAIEFQLNESQWKESDIVQFKDNLKKSLQQAAYVMQTLRSNMADVHGTKPVINIPLAKALAFDSIKWSQILVRLLSEKYS